MLAERWPPLLFRNVEHKTLYVDEVDMTWYFISDDHSYVILLVHEQTSNLNCIEVFLVASSCAETLMYVKLEFYSGKVFS